jgi:hypothetical protein
VTIYDSMIRTLAEVVGLGDALLGHWVGIPANASGPLDPNITLTETGTHLVQYLASFAAQASNMICAVLDALF